MIGARKSRYTKPPPLKTALSSTPLLSSRFAKCLIYGLLVFHYGLTLWPNNMARCSMMANHSSAPLKACLEILNYLLETISIPRHFAFDTCRSGVHCYLNAQYARAVEWCAGLFERAIRKGFWPKHWTSWHLSQPRIIDVNLKARRCLLVGLVAGISLSKFSLYVRLVFMFCEEWRREERCLICWLWG